MAWDGHSVDHALAMRSLTKILSVGLTCGLSACAGSLSLGPGAGGRDDLTPVTLIASAEARQGEIVTVRGYFTAGTDTQALWQDSGAWEDVGQRRHGPLHSFDYWTKCLTVFPSTSHAWGLSDRNVRVTGTVVIIPEDDIRSLWACNRVALWNAVVVGE